MMAHRRTWTSAASPLGREGECRTLDEFLGPIREGLSRALVVSGEAGIGKTRLLQYAADAADGFLLATADGAESERPQGFSGLHRLLLPFLDRVGRLPAPQRDALSTAFGLAAGPPADLFRVGLGALSGKAFRIAHMGHVNAPMILGTLGVIEVGLRALRVPHGTGGVQAAIDWLGESVCA